MGVVQKICLVPARKIVRAKRDAALRKALRREAREIHLHWARLARRRVEILVNHLALRRPRGFFCVKARTYTARARIGIEEDHRGVSRERATASPAESSCFGP